MAGSLAMTLYTQLPNLYEFVMAMWPMGGHTHATGFRILKWSVNHPLVYRRDSKNDLRKGLGPPIGGLPCVKPGETSGEHLLGWLLQWVPVSPPQ